LPCTAPRFTIEIFRHHAAASFMGTIHSESEILIKGVMVVALWFGATVFGSFSGKKHPCVSFFGKNTHVLRSDTCPWSQQLLAL
jgi:hypothetical protein